MLMATREGEMSALKVIDIPEDRPPLALELPAETSFDEWVSIGRRLCLGQQALNWHIGDWWAFGDHRYGERAKAAAEGLFGREFQTLRIYGTVARAFEPFRRLNDLTFSHHQEAASLPAEEADTLLDRAQRERLSTRDLRREVQALKAANDPERSEDEPPPSKPVPAQTDRATTITAYEMAIEFAEALQQMRPLSRRENDMLSTAMAAVGEARSGAKAGPPPQNFDVIFVEQGRVACEEIFHKSRLTINHWLIQRGKSRLIKMRAEFVRFQRDQQRPTIAVVEPSTAMPFDELLVEVAREAANFLRISRYGGWTITYRGEGVWLVGTVRKTSDELIAMAERQGFDSEAARNEAYAD